MNRLAGHPEPKGHLRHNSAVAQRFQFQHRRMPLLHHTELHQHDDPSHSVTTRSPHTEEGSAPPEVDHRGVTQLPEPVSPSYRNRVPEVSHTYRSQRVKHHPGQHTGQGRAPTTVCVLQMVTRFDL